MRAATPTATVSAVDVRALERAHEELQLGWADISRIIGVDESTVHRWRSGMSVPRPIARSRMEQLEELLELLTRLFSGPDLARAWLAEGRPEGLGGRETPLAVMRAGRMDRVLTLLHFLARGG